FAATLFYGSVAIGRGGAITGDDANYASLSWGLVQWLHGEPSEPFVPPLWHGEAYLFGTYVYLETALFWVIGPMPLGMSYLNCGLGATLVVLVYVLARRHWTARAAAVGAILTALFPSLV